jgi:ABC-type histidine transport system ATPase subunit
MSEFALNLVGIHKSFGSKAMLKGVDLSLPGAAQVGKSRDGFRH